MAKLSNEMSWANIHVRCVYVYSGDPILLQKINQHVVAIRQIPKDFPYDF